MNQPRSIYCLACGQTYISSSVDTCTLCGKNGSVVDPDSAEALCDPRNITHGALLQIEQLFANSAGMVLLPLIALGGVALVVAGGTFILAESEDVLSQPATWSFGVPCVLGGAGVLVMVDRFRRTVLDFGGLRRRDGS